MPLPIGFYWLYNLLSSDTKKLLSAGEESSYPSPPVIKDQSYISAPTPTPTVTPPTPPTPTPTVTPRSPKPTPTVTPRPPKPKLAPPPPPPKPKPASPSTAPTPRVTSLNIPISIKPQGTYTGGNSLTDIIWRNYWTAQARKQDVYQFPINASQSPPSTAQYSELSVAQRQLFRKKRREGASWEEALNAARSNR